MMFPFCVAKIQASGVCCYTATGSGGKQVASSKIGVLMIGNDTGTNWMILRYFRDALSKSRYDHYCYRSYYWPTLILNPLLRLLFSGGLLQPLMMWNKMEITIGNDTGTWII